MARVITVPLHTFTRRLVRCCLNSVFMVSLLTTSNKMALFMDLSQFSLLQDNRSAQVNRGWMVTGYLWRLAGTGRTCDGRKQCPGLSFVSASFLRELAAVCWLAEISLSDTLKVCDKGISVLMKDYLFS